MIDYISWYTFLKTEQQFNDFFPHNTAYFFPNRFNLADTISIIWWRCHFNLLLICSWEFLNLLSNCNQICQRGRSIKVIPGCYRLYKNLKLGRWEIYFSFLFRNGFWRRAKEGFYCALAQKTSLQHTSIHPATSLTGCMSPGIACSNSKHKRET